MSKFRGAMYTIFKLYGICLILARNKQFICRNALFVVIFLVAFISNMVFADSDASSHFSSWRIGGARGIFLLISICLVIREWKKIEDDIMENAD